MKSIMGFLKKDAFLQMLALTFLILIPFSFLLSPFLFLIPIFLYFFVLTLQDKGWIISQRWMDVVFIHYKVDAKELQKIVPFPLDLFEGEAVVSIVPFVMGRIRFPFLIPIPGLQSSAGSIDCKVVFCSSLPLKKVRFFLR